MNKDEYKYVEIEESNSKCLFCKSTLVDNIILGVFMFIYGILSIIAYCWNLVTLIMILMIGIGMFCVILGLFAIIYSILEYYSD